jgi:hypothetical protein
MARRRSAGVMGMGLWVVLALPVVAARAGTTNDDTQVEAVRGLVGRLLGAQHVTRSTLGWCLTSPTLAMTERRKGGGTRFLADRAVLGYAEGCGAHVGGPSKPQQHEHTLGFGTARDAGEAHVKLSRASSTFGLIFVPSMALEGGGDGAVSLDGNQRFASNRSAQSCQVCRV